VNIWLIFVLGGLLTFAMRFSFIYAFGRFSVPPALHRALRFVPPAVLSAIVFPAVLMPDDRLELGFGNHRLLAAAVAVIVAFWTRKTLPTIIAGIIALLIIQAVS